MSLVVRIMSVMMKVQANIDVARAQMEGVIEQKMDGINYAPHVYNDHISLQNVLVKPNRLVLRSSIDESSMVRWDLPNDKDNWSFTISFNELNLNSSESAGLYLFYTKEKPIIGSFKGANSIFHGFAAGIEFNGKGVDLIYAKNNGLDYHNVDEYVSKVDSLNPQRFKNTEYLKLKVICTDRNFKIEIYDGQNIIYDNFRFFTKEDLENHKGGKYFGIFADYKNVSSAKAFEINSVQLAHREESKEYSVSKTYMSKIAPTMRNKHEIAHPNTDVQDFIFKVNAVASYTKSLLGELPETTLNHSEKELIKEMDTLNEKLEKLKAMQRNQVSRDGISNRLNDFELKIKKIFRSISDIDYVIEDLNEKASGKYNFLEYLTIFGGISAMIILLVRELSEYRATNKAQNLK